jgi:peptide/nickel transport system substrate-binding protein
MLTANRPYVTIGVVLMAVLAALLVLAACGGKAESGQRRELETGSGRPPLIKSKGETTPVPTFTPSAPEVIEATEPPATTEVMEPTEAPTGAVGVGVLDWAKPSAASLSKFADSTQGGTLIVGLKSPIGSLDPDVNLTGNAHQVIVNVYEGALERDWAYATTEGYDAPFVSRSFGLAKAVRWEDTTLIFEFEEGVTFHDGTPFNAEAALFSWQRLWDEDFEYYYPEAAAVAADIGQLIADDGRAMEVLDEYTLAVTLTERNWDFPDWLSTYVRYAIVSPTAIKEFGFDGLTTRMVGTGPFKLVSHEPNVRTVLEANLDYWRGRPNLDRLIFIPIPDEGARVAALLNGDVDVIYEVGPDFVEQIQTRDDLTFYTRGKPSVWELQPNYKFEGSPLLNPTVRKALSLAVDRSGMADILMKGTMAPANMFSSPEASTHDPAVPVDDYDPVRAKELLAEAGYPDGFDIKVKIPGAGCGIPGTIIMTEMVQSQWAEIGVNLDITGLDWVQYVGEWIQGAEDPSNTDYEMLSMCSGLDSPYRVAMDIATKTWSPGGWNVGHYSNPEVDSLLAEATVAPTYDEYIELTKQAQVVSIDETQNFWLVHDGNPIAASNKIKGWKPAREWVDRFTYAWIEE